MRLLVLGGTVFLSHAVASECVRRGHEVVCACRGESGSVPDEARLARWDRAAEPPPTIEADAVVDVGRRPTWVRAAVAAWPEAHWTFVSTVNVYADDSAPDQTPATGRLVEPVDEGGAEAYGPMKVACEQAVRDVARTAFVVRPGLIVGPGDPTGRGAYWPERLADDEHREVLAPGSADDVVQVIDVRDLAAWIVDAAELHLTGTFDAVGQPTPIGDLLMQAAPHRADDLTWVPTEFLEAHGVEPWMGPDSIPLWLPRPTYDGMLAHDPTPSLAAGLRLRPVAETANDTLEWLREQPGTPRTGLTRKAERELLDAWHDRPA